ncbi:hypothetical protein Back11_50980 [Paenibacillus baekrokdamisoli]|uniref:Uncharacterized protein n=1 Tax=Paenibacillus baekrokdamisoli TaxID=1712516 RepID=A0A3G9JFK0_9BACL|nr:EAL domain-containing protein [Paenibacillus baekrokdamisoli]MBB3068931.1 diguanylate cyclase (GGDEF)-like protein [Paenibacillus baekrokdamisoli]BBH23753.1 hypothetical protein Back11_50980 [Paenibacillus baekrokdamisoli]
MNILLKESRQQKNVIVLRLLLLNFSLFIAVLTYAFLKMGLPVKAFCCLNAIFFLYVFVYAFFYRQRKDSPWIGFIPIVGHFIVTLMLMYFIPAVSNFFSSMYLIVLAAVFMRKEILYIGLLLSALADILFIYSSKVTSLPLTQQVTIGVSMWSIMMALALLFIIYNDKKLMGRVFALQKETIKKAEQINHLATTDSLTSLPNRISSCEYLEAALLRMYAIKGQLGVIVLDVDHFQVINDSLGHSIGDQCLEGFAKQLIDKLPKRIYISRLGGDEFSFVIENYKDHEDLMMLVHSIWEAAQTPIAVAGVSIQLKVNMGIAIYPEHGYLVEMLLMNANVAMQRARSNGKNSYLLFDGQMKLELLEKRKLEEDMKEAFANEDFDLHYQQQVHVPSGSVKGYEALLRWEHPCGTFIPPSDWIPLAEETGHIVAIGDWVLRKACLTAKRWHDDARNAFTMSVNISALQLMQPDFADRVLAIVAETGLNPCLLILELTETLLIQSMETSKNQLNQIRERGVRIALDDFGKGFSSLSYIKQLPIDIVKIDKSFLDHIEHSLVDRAVVESIISLVQRIDMEVVAEGVEDQEQLRILQEIGCHYVQGYYYSRPQPEHIAFPGNAFVS